MHSGSHQPVYKPTTTTGQHGYQGGYLQQHSSRGCCGASRKRRLQLLLLLGAAAAAAAAILLFTTAITGTAGGSGGVGAAVAVVAAVLLAAVAAALFVFHLRAQGRIHLPCWPSRAAVLAQTLTAAPETPPRSETLLTVATEDDVRVKLMEESDTTEAEKIEGSAPKVVLMEKA